jgi:hypothetical protein
MIGIIAGSVGAALVLGGAGVWLYRKRIGKKESLLNSDERSNV